MANRYWVGGTGTWDTTAGTKWSTTSGGAGGASVPGVADIAIFDANSNPAGSGASYTVTTTSTSVSGLRVSNPSAGVVTVAGATSSIGIGSDGLVVNSGVNWTQAGNVNFSGTSTFSSQASIAANVAVASGTLTLNSNLTSGKELRCSAGNLVLGSFNATASTFTSSGTTNRTLNFGTGAINVTSTAATTIATVSGNITIAGTSPTINLTGNTTSLRDVSLVIPSESNSISLTSSSTGGTIRFAVSSTVRNLTINAGGVDITSGSLTVYGNLNMTSGSISAPLIFAATSPGKTISTGTAVINNSLTFNGLGGEWILQNAVTTSSGVTLTAGTLNLNGYKLKFGAAFISSNTNIRGINFGSGGSLEFTASTSTWNTAIATNLTVTGTPSVIFPTASSTSVITINTGTPTEENSVSFSFPFATGTTAQDINFSGGQVVRSVSFPVACTINSAGPLTIYGDFNIGSAARLNATTVRSFDFASTKTGNTITTNGLAIIWPMSFSGTGAWTLTDSLNVGTLDITHSAGTINTNGVNITAGSIISTSSTSRTLNLGSSTITLSKAAFWTSNAGLTVSPGTSTVIASGVAPVLSTGSGQTFGNMTFSSTALTSVTINGQNSFNNLTFTHPAAAAYSPVIFGADQTINGTLSVTGTLLGTARLFFRSSVDRTQRTITAAAISGLDDIDFRDIIAAGPAIPWTGTRLGDATNNQNITFATPKTVWWVGTTSGNWNSSTWSLTQGGATSANNFPLPQDTANLSTIVTLTLNLAYNIGNINATGNTQLSVSSTTPPNILGNVSGSNSGFRINQLSVRFYNPSPSSIQTISMTTNNNTTTFIIDTNGTVRLGANFTNNSTSITLNRGTLDTNNFSLSVTSILSISTDTRVLNLGSSTVTLGISSLGQPAFKVSGSNFTLNAGTSTIVFTGSSFTFLTDIDLTLFNVSLAPTNAATQGDTREFGSVSYYENDQTTTNKVSITVNNFSIGNPTAGICSPIRFWGMTALTVQGTLSIGSGSNAQARTLLHSMVGVTTLSANAVSSLTDVDFSGIAVTGTSAPWSGTRLGNSGRNSGITFPAPKTVYWTRTVAAGNAESWYGLNWATTPTGTPDVNSLPLGQDTAVINDSYIGANAIIDWSNNFSLPYIDLTARTVAMQFGVRGYTLLPVNYIGKSIVTFVNRGNFPLYFTGTDQDIDLGGVALSSGTSAIVSVAGRVRLLSNFSTGAATSVYTGNVELNNFTWTSRNLEVFYPETKSLVFGTGSISLNGNNLTVVNIPLSASAGFSVTGTPVVNLTYASSVGTRTISTPGCVTESQSISFNVTAGTDIVTVGTGTNPSGIRNLSFQGSNPTWSNNLVNMFGGLTLGSTITNAKIQDVSFTYKGSGPSSITSNGKTINGVISIDTPTGSLSLQDSMILAAYLTNPAYLKLTNGSFDANGFNVTAPRVVAPGTLARNLTMGSGTWTISGNDDGTIYAWDMSSITSLVLLAGSSTIRLTGSGTQTFNGGAQTYNVVSVDGAGTKIFNQRNVFTTMTNTVRPTTILFEGGIPQTFTNFTVSGTAGNLVTISSTSQTNATLYKISEWTVGANSVDGGNNLGLLFAPGSGIDYLNISYITGTNSPPTDGIIMTGFTGTGFTVTF